MRLDEALSDVEAIRGQLGRLQVATCYRSATTAASGTIALLAAALQPGWVVPQDTNLRAEQFLIYWSIVAVCSVLMIGTEMGWRYWTTAAPRDRRHTRETLKEFLPSVAIGTLLGLLFTWQLPQHASLLPGLWAIVFGMGILATLKRLPSGGAWIAIYYLVSGFLCIKFATGSQTLAPWTMAVTFGVGQWVAATVLHLAKQPKCLPESNLDL
jgi:hypothetical protein